MMNNKSRCISTHQLQSSHSHSTLFHHPLRHLLDMSSPLMFDERSRPSHVDTSSYFHYHSMNNFTHPPFDNVHAHSSPATSHSHAPQWNAPSQSQPHYDDSPFVFPSQESAAPSDADVCSYPLSPLADEISGSTSSLSFDLQPSYPPYTSLPAAINGASAGHCTSQLDGNPQLAPLAPSLSLASTTSSSSSSSSRASSRPLSSTGSVSSFPSPFASASSTPRADGKKRRSSELDPQRRKERRRAQHRAVDSNRRLKEAEAIERLQRVIIRRQEAAHRGVAGRADEEQSTDSSVNVKAEAETEERDKKVARLTVLNVLDSSLALIEQLTSACQRMEAACSAKDAQLSRASNHLHSVAAAIAHRATSSYENDNVAADELFPTPFPSDILSFLPPSTASYLGSSDRSQSLRSGSLTLFSSSFCLAVISRGIVIDLNERFLSGTRWRRSDLLHTSVDVDAVNPDPSIPPTPFALGKMVRQGSKWQRSILPQYPASFSAIEALMKGEQRKGDIMMRCRLGDGTICEVKSTMWAEYDDEAAVSGGVMRRPDRTILMFAMEDAVVIDKLDASHMCSHANVDAEP